MKTFSSDKILLFMSIASIIVSLILFSWHAWIRYVHIADWGEKVRIEEQALTDLQLDQEALMSDELRVFLREYGQVLSALDAVFLARDQVFSGQMTEDRFEPVLVLDLLPFFELLRARLSPQVVLNKVSLSPGGELGFLVQATSYRAAAQQLEVFQYGFSDEDFTQLFQDVSVSAVSQTKLSLAQLETLPDVLKGLDASFDFLVKMQINPKYFSDLALRKQEEEAFNDESSTS